MLDVHKIPFIAVDSDPRLVARARAAGERVYYGDASRPDYLRRCGALAALGVPTEARPKMYQRAMGVIFEMISFKSLCWASMSAV